MPADYHVMWKELGLDLRAHDALLEVLGKAYGDIFLTQENRPGAMEYFNFVIGEVHGLRVKELVEARAHGRKVIGSFCLFVPEELILAVDGISIGLCAGASFATEEAEKMLPRTTCALIKSFFGFKLAKVCPYIEVSDMIVGENTCDGKKKAYEIFGNLVDYFYAMDLPQTKSEAGKGLLKAEYVRFAEALEALSGRKMTAEGLKKGMRTVNDKRRVLQRLNALRAADPAPISGLDALLINQLSFFDDPARFTGAVTSLCDELDERVGKGQGAFPKGRPRIVLSGCPMAIPNWKVPMIVESSGAVIVAEESCVGERGTRWLTTESGDTVEALIDSIVERTFQIDCAIFTPNPSRLEAVKEMVKSRSADGVIHYSLQFCQPYQVESQGVEKELEKAGVPVLRIDTDYSTEDLGQLKTRVEAFVERISRKSCAARG
jgi:benzoyl-CoA reductase/2-hydroxyglutaryl-CoA dehydratase subunit BcrC/BadD/HgdB